MERLYPAVIALYGAIGVSARSVPLQRVSVPVANAEEAVKRAQRLIRDTLRARSAHVLVEGWPDEHSGARFVVGGYPTRTPRTHRKGAPCRCARCTAKRDEKWLDRLDRERGSIDNVKLAG